jgi:hypothetical protein
MFAIDTSNRLIIDAGGLLPVPAYRWVNLHQTVVVNNNSMESHPILNPKKYNEAQTTNLIRQINVRFERLCKSFKIEVTPFVRLHEVMVVQFIWWPLCIGMIVWT